MSGSTAWLRVAPTSAMAKGRREAADDARDGQLKERAPYMAPEQIRALPVDARTDVYAASVVLWEALADAVAPLSGRAPRWGS